MALQGTIADWSFADVLQVISTQKKSGTVKLDGGDEDISFTLLDGGIVAADVHEPNGKSGFVRFLLETQRIGPERARQIDKLLRDAPAPVMAVVEHSDLLPADELETAIEIYVQELVHHILQWEEGDYEFIAHSVQWESTREPLGTEGLLLEGMRRIDEWARIAEVVTPESIFRPVRQAPVPPDLPPRDRALLRLVDGVQDTRALRRHARLTDYELGESLWNLHHLGLIETAGTDPGVTEVIELAPDQLEPERRIHRLVRLLSLVALVLGSVVLGWITTGPDGLGTQPVSGHLDRSEQAVRFALELYRVEKGVYPRSLAELATLGTPLPAPDRLTYDPDTERLSYVLTRDDARESSPDH